jgi:hypothetical protein
MEELEKNPIAHTPSLASPQLRAFFGRDLSYMAGEVAMNDQVIYLPRDSFFTPFTDVPCSQFHMFMENLLSSFLCVSLLNASQYGIMTLKFLYHCYLNICNFLKGRR